MDEELFRFEPEGTASESLSTAAAWKVLSVEDDVNYQASLVHALDGYQVRQRPIEMLTAASAAQAAEMLVEHNDLCVVLLDVVMEDDNAGLRLVDNIRQVLGNSSLRIVLLTGQPGMAPLHDVMQRYDIDEYWNKADLSSEKLRTVVASNIRTWNAYHELDKARHGLSLLVDASRQLSKLTNIDEFCKLLLQEINSLIDLSRGGIICARNQPSLPPEDYQVITSSGVFASRDGDIQTLFKHIPASLQQTLSPLISRAISEKSHHFVDNFSVLYFAADPMGDSSYIMVVESAKPLSQYHINLLQVFSENVSNGFNNIVLCNRLSELAYFDSELKLPNRAWLMRFLDHLPQDERAQSMMLALEIRDFEELRLSVESQFLTEFMQQFYQKLQQRFAAQRVIARVADNCFMIVLDPSSQPTLEDVVRLHHFKVVTNNVQLHVEVNVARMALAELAKASGRDLLYMMDATLVQSKRDNLSIVEYRPQFRQEIRQRHALMQGLNNAIDSGRLLLMFQPKVSLNDGKVVGLEALARWQETDGKFIPPGQFVPVAEMSGLINKLDLHVMYLTVAAVKQLRQQGYALPISFNVTSSDLDDLTFWERLDSICQQEPELVPLLEIEITESQTMQDYHHTKPLLHNLIRKGIGVSIDDFGTGYSSLQHVAELAATHLKIDKSFVDGMCGDGCGDAVVDMVIKLGQRFNYTVIAEGIETAEQAKRLQSLGCRYGQGFYFAKPMAMPELLAFLAQGHTAQGESRL